MVKGRFGAVLGVVIGLVGLVAAACSSSDGGEAAKRSWLCSEDDESCSCRAYIDSPGQAAAVFNEVEACFDTSCCLLTQSSANDSDALCECLPDVADCAAEAKSRRGVEQVSQCPPPGEGPEASTLCAAPGENCGQSYLDQNQLSGCCQGLVCKPNSADVSVCQEATEKELGYAELCSRAERSDELQTLVVATSTLVTSVGELTLPPVKFAFFTVGPAGCVNSLRVLMGTASAFDCQLELEAELVAGALTFAKIRGDLSGCAGYDAGDGPADGYLTTTSAPPGDLTFETVACDGRLVFESYCVGGSFDFHLDGVIDGVTFEDQHIILQGGMCSEEPQGDCPLP
jgi:hypothetical protein